MNWIVAGSFKLFGVRNEWTAPLPSALFLLGVAVLLRTIAGSILAAAGSTIAALCWLTHPPRLRGGESVLFIIED